MAKKCNICGKELLNVQRVTCENENCVREHRKRYVQNYRLSHKKQVALWQRQKQQRNKENREPNRCRQCGTELKTYTKKFCVECKHDRLLKSIRNYYRNHVKEEAERKRIWYQKNKKLVWQRRQERIKSGIIYASKNNIKKLDSKSTRNKN